MEPKKVSARIEMPNSIEHVKRTTQSLLNYCHKKNWAGFDPYDSLNSRIFQITPFKESRICRLVFIQLMKRMPINLRRLLLVPERQNAKAIGLFLSAIVKLSKSGFIHDEALIKDMIDHIVNLRSRNHKYWCWGYSFPWQTRTIIVPSGAPNIVCTTFVMHSLLDAYEILKDPALIDMAISAADYISNDLFWEEPDGIASFSYPLPSLRTKVHNANFLGAAVLSRVYRYTSDEKYLAQALKVTRYSAKKQRPNGAWVYGDHHTQGWADNFHTGFNLCALQVFSQCLRTNEFEDNIVSGFRYYTENFFENRSIPKYYDKRKFPVDIHSVAQSIITLIALKELDNRSISLAWSVYKWAMDNMWNKQGYFYYQVTPYGKNKISYMRWSQAWMFYALSCLYEFLTNDN